MIKRGNTRRAIFHGAGEARTFLPALEPTVVRSGWRLPAGVLRCNHDHLAVETPQPSLTDGMHWLQTTFSTRFNRLQRERGQLFQGRYQSILVECFRAMAVVADSMHLNPVRGSGWRMNCASAVRVRVVAAQPAPPQFTKLGLTPFVV